MQMILNKNVASLWFWKKLSNSNSCKFRAYRGVKTWPAAAVLVFLMVLSGCRSLGPVEPVSPEIQEEIERRCRQHFIDRPWQFVQSLTAYLPNGAVRNSIAVIRIDPARKRIKCVITSLEGITLFKGEYDRQVEILKAVPPFDSEKFSGTMFGDIRLFFFSPEGRAVETGKTASGASVCRYELKDGGFVEVLFRQDGRREIRRYSGHKKHLATIEACYSPNCSRRISEAGTGIPVCITIYKHGLLEYRLELDLIKAEPLAAYN